MILLLYAVKHGHANIVKLLGQYGGNIIRRRQNTCSYFIILGINTVDLLFKVTVYRKGVIDTSFVWINPVPPYNMQTTEDTLIE